MAIFSSKTFLRMSQNAEINIYKGSLIVGKRAKNQMYSSYEETNIDIEDGGSIEVYGDCLFSPGTTIKVKKNAKLVLKGNNFFSHNTMILCDKYIEVGSGAIASWNLTLIDYDGHKLQTRKNKLISAMQRPLVIGSNVALQSDITIPAGLSIGANVVVSTGTILRKSLPANCHAYASSILVVKNNRRMRSDEAWS